MIPLYDTHNHLQDGRLDPWRESVMRSLPDIGLKAAVVNGSAEDDWEAAASLANQYPWVRPSFGLHPWHVRERSATWLETLKDWLQHFPVAAVGEIGLDRWIENPDIEAQVSVFKSQMELAAELERPATIHCLRAWGLLDEVMRDIPITPRGFLLHSFGGPAEMIPLFVKRGAYFSLSPYFIHPRKAAQLAVFRHVPLDRLLAETDAPDMWPPDDSNPNPLKNAEGNALNHPANIRLSYQILADLRGMSLADLAAQLERNYLTLFGGG
jgi:TatD DNase family protein